MPRKKSTRDVYPGINVLREPKVMRSTADLTKRVLYESIAMICQGCLMMAFYSTAYSTDVVSRVWYYPNDESAT